MRVKTTAAKKCFNAYTVEISVESLDEHEALCYASKCCSVLPDALREKAMKSSYPEYRNNSESFYKVFKLFLNGIDNAIRRIKV